LPNVKIYNLFLILGIIFFSCSKEKYEAQIPAYISIDQITLTTDLATEGSASSNITDAWVYINDDFIGAFELPATFPVLKEGTAKLKVYAGIKENGISASRTRYLLYDPHEEQVNLVKGETLNIVPYVTDNSDVKFSWLEDFENASLSFLYSPGNDTIINKVNTGVKEGVYSGYVYLTSSMDFFEATSPAFSSLPQNGSPIFLELDFKIKEPLSIGVYVDTEQHRKITLNDTESNGSYIWKKIYINLTDIINSKPNVAEVKVYFGIKDTPSLPFVTTNPEIYIDNIKLVHY
jgi:hypothetical protein